MEISNECTIVKNEEVISKEKTFRFYDIFDNRDDVYCDVTINVLEKISGGKPIYDISYYYNIPNISTDNYKLSLRAHPFFYSKNIKEEDKEGVIVFKNSMTDKLVEYLLMDPEELEKISGNTYWVQYKIKIMESLALFWD